MKKDTHRDHDDSTNVSSLPVTRRQFLKRMGVLSGGVIVYFTVGDSLAWAQRRRAGFLAANIPSQGGGEPAIVCMGGVIATAIYDATGAKLFQLPMTPARVKEALNKV